MILDHASAPLSRRKQGFESPRERQSLFVHSDFSGLYALVVPPMSEWDTQMFIL